MSDLDSPIILEVILNDTGALHDNVSGYLPCHRYDSVAWHLFCLLLEPGDRGKSDSVSTTIAQWGSGSYTLHTARLEAPSLELSP